MFVRWIKGFKEWFQQDMKLEEGIGESLRIILLTSENSNKFMYKGYEVELRLTTYQRVSIYIDGGFFWVLKVRDPRESHDTISRLIRSKFK